jgi:hypothetical protein
MRYALVDADGLVVNAIVWDGETDYTPADGLTVVAIPDEISAGLGWTYDGTNWIAPPVEDEEVI